MKRLWFLRDVYKRTKPKHKNARFIADKLEIKGDVVFSEMSEADEFIIQMEKHMRSRSRSRSRFRFGKVEDLLRLISFMMSKDVPTDIKGLLGTDLLQGLDDYLGSKFPNLLMVVYDVMRRYCKEEGCFHYYMKESL